MTIKINTEQISIGKPRLQTIGHRGGASVPTTFTLTCTTTGAATLTLQKLTVAAGKTVTVSWGDTNSNNYTGTGARTHAYAGAGTYTVTMSLAADIIELDLRDTKLSGSIDASNPMPTGLTSLTLYSLSLSWTVSATAPMPTGLTSLYLYSLSGLSWTSSSTVPIPTGLQTMVVTGCPSALFPYWTGANAIRTVQLENAYSQANVDAICLGIWGNKPNFTYATPSLDILGGSNATPSGIYQTASPPTTGKEYLYDLVNGSYTPAGPEWTVQYQT